MKIIITNPLMKKLEIAALDCRRSGDMMGLSRIEAMMMVGQKVALPDIAKIKAVKEETLLSWISKCIVSGVKALFSKKRYGAIPKLLPDERIHLAELLISGPQACGYDTGCWRLVLIQDLIFRFFQVSFSIGHLSRLLREMNFSYKKAKFKFSRRDEEARAEWMEKTFPDLVAKAKRESSKILFGDEVGFGSSSRTGYTWSKKGEVIFIPHPGANHNIKAFGAIDITDHRLTYHVTEGHLNSDSFMDFLRILLRKYTGKKIILILDNAQYHKSAQMHKSLETYKEQIELIFLPAYSPDYNPIEQLWKVMKSQYIYNMGITNRCDLKKRVSLMFRSMQVKFSKHQSLYEKWTEISNQITMKPANGFELVLTKATEFIKRVFLIKPLRHAV